MAVLALSPASDIEGRTQGGSRGGDDGKRSSQSAESSYGPEVGQRILFLAKTQICRKILAPKTKA